MKRLAALLSWLQSFPQLKDVDGDEESVHRAFTEIISEIYGESIDDDSSSTTTTKDWKDFLKEKYPDVAAAYSSDDGDDQLQSELTINLLGNVLRYAVSKECPQRAVYVKCIMHLPTDIKRSLKRIIEQQQQQQRVLHHDDCASQTSAESSSNLSTQQAGPLCRSSDVSITSSQKTCPSDNTSSSSSWLPSKLPSSQHSPPRTINTKNILQTISFRRGRHVAFSSSLTGSGSGYTPDRKKRSITATPVSDTHNTTTIHQHREQPIPPSSPSPSFGFSMMSAPPPNSRVSQRVSDLEAMVQQLQDHNERVENDLEASLRREAELESRVTRKHRSQMIACEEEAMRKIEQAHASHKKEMAVMGKALQQLRKTHEKGKKELAEMDALREEVERLRETSKELEKRDKQLHKCEERVDEMTDTIESKIMEKNEAQAKCIELEVEVLDLRNQLECKTEQLESAAACEQAVDRPDNEAAVKSPNDDVEALRDELDVLRNTNQKLQVAEEQLCKYRDIIEEMSVFKEALVQEQEAHKESAEKCARLEEELKRVRSVRSHRSPENSVITDLAFLANSYENDDSSNGKSIGYKEEDGDAISSVLSGENTSETQQDTRRRSINGLQNKLLEAWKENRISSSSSTTQEDGEAQQPRISKAQQSLLNSTLSQLEQAQQALAEAEGREKILKEKVMALDLTVVTLQQQLNDEKEKSEKLQRTAIRQAKKSVMEEAKKNLDSVEQKMNLLLQAERKQSKKKADKAQEIVKAAKKEKRDLEKKHEESMEGMKLSMEMAQAHFDSVEEDYQQQIDRLRLQLSSSDRDSMADLTRKIRQEVEAEVLKKICDKHNAEIEETQKKATSKINRLQTELATAARKYGALKAATEVQEELVSKLTREKEELLRDRRQGKQSLRQNNEDRRSNSREKSTFDFLENEYHALLQDIMSFKKKSIPPNDIERNISSLSTWDTASY